MSSEYDIDWLKNKVSDLEYLLNRLQFNVNNIATETDGENTTLTFYTASAARGYSDTSNTVTIENGLVTSWVTELVAYLLMETGDFLLTEDGDRIVLDL